MDFEKEQEEWAKVGLHFCYDKVDLEFEGYSSSSRPQTYTKINGATVNQQKQGAFVDVYNN